MEIHRRVDELQVLDALGEGSFGRVFRVRANSRDGDEEEEPLLACKVFDAEEPSDLQDIAHEISIMQSLRKAVLALDRLKLAPPLVLIHGYHVGLSAQDPVSYITMDLCNGGSLSSLLKDCTCLSEAEAALVLASVAEGLLFCHMQASILHRDIKPANILFSKKGSLNSACLADFGISVHLDGKDGVYYGRPGEGSRAFMAPEAQEYGYYSAASDVWGLGAVLFFMLTGTNPPRQQGSCEADFEKAGDAWWTLSSPVRNLIQGMLCSDRHTRLTLLQVLNHPWITAGTTPSAHKHIEQRKGPCLFTKDSLAIQPVDFHRAECA